MKTITLQQFQQSYLKRKKTTPSYRYGQAFVNVFIKNEYSDERLVGLWEADFETAAKAIYTFMEENQWDSENMVVLREECL